MKLLFDANVSHKLVKDLSSEYHDSAHVREAGLRGARDHEIWDHARFPPKVIWLDVGNAGTPAISGLLRRERQRVEHFGASEEAAVLILSIGERAV